MTLNEFKKYWNKKTSEETNIEINEDDLFFIISGYAFVIDDKQNVIMKKIAENKFSLKDVFRMFRLTCLKNNIKYIRVEGNTKQYNFLSKMFKYVSVIQDFEIKDRNVFFVKL